MPLIAKISCVKSEDKYLLNTPVPDSSTAALRTAVLSHSASVARYKCNPFYPLIHDTISPLPWGFSAIAHPVGWPV